MDQESAKAITVRCACGKHYRIRTPKAGARTTCPECGSMIEVTAADLDTSFDADGSIRIHQEQVEPQEAILLDGGEVTVAKKGARLGVTEGVTFAHEEAQLADAISGHHVTVAPEEAATLGLVASEKPTIRRSFVGDLLASFYFAGNWHNAFNILIMGFVYALIFYIGSLIFLPFSLIMVIPYAFIVLYVIQFYWMVLTVTADGEDHIPWFESDWDWWSNAFKPFLWVLWISFVCSLPGLLALWYIPSSDPTRMAMIWAGLLAGWFFWPVAVMSVALGNTILFIRPDWLIRCIWGIGWVYIVAWVAVMVTLAAWVLFIRAPEPALVQAVPIIGYPVYLFFCTCLQLCFGYVLFRMLGLLFRHFRARFPWKY